MTLHEDHHPSPGSDMFPVPQLIPKSEGIEEILAIFDDDFHLGENTPVNGRSKPATPRAKSSPHLSLCPPPAKKERQDPVESKVLNDFW